MKSLPLTFPPWRSPVLLFSYVYGVLTFTIAQAPPPRDSSSADLGWGSGILYFDKALMCAPG